MPRPESQPAVGWVRNIFMKSETAAAAERKRKMKVSEQVYIGDVISCDCLTYKRLKFLLPFAYPRR